MPEQNIQPGLALAKLFLTATSSYGKIHYSRTVKIMESPPDNRTGLPEDPRVSSLLTTLPEQQYPIRPGQNTTRVDSTICYKPVKYHHSFRRITTHNEIHENKEHIVAAIDPKTKKASLFITPKRAATYDVFRPKDNKLWKYDKERGYLFQAELGTFVAVMLVPMSDDVKSKETNERMKRNRKRRIERAIEGVFR